MGNMMNSEIGPWQKGGQWIAELRQAQQITRAELAEQIDVPSARWIEEVEAGRRPVPSALYRAYAVQFGWYTADFAARCLSFYDPLAYQALFGTVTASAAISAPIMAPATDGIRHAA